MFVFIHVACKCLLLNHRCKRGHTWIDVMCNGQNIHISQSMHFIVFSLIQHLYILHKYQVNTQKKTSTSLSVAYDILASLGNFILCLKKVWVGTDEVRIVYINLDIIRKSSFCDGIEKIRL